MRALKLSLDQEIMKNYLKLEFEEGDPVAEQEMELISEMISEAEAEARNFLNTDFHHYDDTGVFVEEQEAPPQVNGWIRNRTAQKYEMRGNEPDPDFKKLQHLRVYPIREDLEPCRTLED